MVLKKRLEYGFSGFQVPTIPRAPRSARRRGPHKKKVEDSQICAFELLASLAGKLLQESESSSASSNASEGNNQSSFDKKVVKHGRRDEDKPVKPVKEECFEPGSSEGSAFVNELTSKSITQKFILKEFPNADSNAVLERTSSITKSDCLDKGGGDVKSVICNSSNAAFQNNPNILEGVFPLIGESYHSNVDNGIEREQEGDKLETDGLANTCSPKDPIELCVKFPAMVSSDSNVELSLIREPVPNASFSKHRNDIKLGSRDDDENFLRCNKPSTKVKAVRPLTRIGDRRIRKLLTSKYWKVAPKLRDYEVSRNDGGTKHLHQKRKACYNRDRCYRDNLHKRRKLFDQSSVVMSDGGFSSESVSNSPEKGSGDKSGSFGILHGATGVSSSVLGRQTSFHSRDSNVKFSVKSFRVPELYVDVPEAATVGSLKKTVMEAVNALLQGGLHVGVLLQGKKIRDDNRTLLQSGISSKGNLGSLSFTLEPNIVEAPPSISSGDPLPSLSCDTSELLTRSPGTPVLGSLTCDDLPEPLPVINSGTQAQSNHEPVSSHTDTLTDEMILDSRALVAVPAMSIEALAVIPVNQKTKRSELAQRRTRRPFSVSEVEALVHAVEELGTGRWRDVKLQAFENADHRTYVDLKDKWKTLVHTAKINPQQRRGEPVPQELLDRVLAAHAYWCQHQAKQHGKHQSGTLKIADAPAYEHGVEVEFTLSAVESNLNSQVKEVSGHRQL
ncbi:hypothetical protein FNV43_RR24790 [Rhamnella rubrinervis]|uniref:Telomere repeat-binding protein 3 n=1 Tax=Rhamnella rubrinervis TaxID=2594499 RepID=A0A8K0DYS4_9ROSA|nr:hypothetical protein FNV43_RR24790 [Rhamnella rubrinervis]